MSNIKYYTNVVPTSLYIKLLEKGMPVNFKTYAEVFDWLLSNGISININIFPPDKRSVSFCLDKENIYGNDTGQYICLGKRNYVPVNAESWIESANDAIRDIIEHL